MGIRLILTQAQSADCVSIATNPVLKMPHNIARLKHGESRANEYHKYFWERMKFTGTQLEQELDKLAEQAQAANVLKLYCECGEVSTCHGQTIRDYLVWELGKRGFDVRSK